MKRCRTCNRTYTDPNLSYCIDDGTPLITEAVADDESTVVNTSSRSERTTEDDWNAVAYRPPSAYVPPGTKQRRTWPWVIGVLGAFVLGAVVLMIAAAIFVPRMIRSRQPAPAPAPAPTQPVIVTNDEPDRTENVNAPAPTDNAQVLEQLTNIENDWTAANLNADKKKLARILADDYVGPRGPPEGGLQGKKEYIDTVQRDSITEKWEFANLKVDLSGDRATLTGQITYFVRVGPSVQVFDFTDKFVWRNGRWQATGSEVYQRQ